MRIARHLYAVSMVAALGAVATPALAAGGKPKQVTSVEGITEYQLDNGLRVLLFPDGSKETVTVNITYFVGSRLEGYGETGMAHLLEHMQFKGTPKHGDTWKLLNEHGATFNASTWYDRTNYFETMPATEDNLKFGLELESDRMINSKIAAEDLAKEFTVVRNEFEMGENNPPQILQERMWSTAYLWHNYGKSTIGSRVDIERVPVPSLHAFYTKYYQPDNAMLVVSGKFDADHVLDLVQQDFGSIPRPTRKLSASYTVEPVQDGERVVTLRRNGDLAVVGVAYHGLAGSDPDFVSSEALVNVLTDEPSGRLYQALVKTGMATRVSGDVLGLADPGMIELFAEVKADKGEKGIDAVRAKMIEVVEGLATSKDKITDAEVNRYKTQALKNWKLEFANSQRVAVGLSEWAAIGDWRMMFIYRDRVKTVDAANVTKVAAQFLKASNRTLGEFFPTKTPDRSPLPKQNIDVAGLVKDYKGHDKIAEGEVFEATVANIEKRTTRGTLKNGLKWAFLPKKTRGEEVHAMLTLHYGAEKDFKGKTTAANLMGDMLMRGTKKKTYQELKDDFDALDAQVDFGGDVGTVQVSITTTRANLSAVVDLVTEVLETPSFPADQFEIIRKEQIGDLQGQLSDPQAQSIIALQRALAPYAKDDVRYVPTTAEQIELLKNAKLADAKALHDTLLGASNAELTIVGDFDATQVTPVLEKDLGTWKSPKPWKRIDRKYKETKAGEQTLDTPDKEMGMIIVAHTLEVRDDDPDYPALQIINYIVGGSASSRLLDRLRQKEGLSYTVFSAIQADPEDKVGVFVAGAIIAPQNAAKGMAAMIDELKKFIDVGVVAKADDNELDKAKASWKKGYDRQLSSDQYVMSKLQQGLYLGRTMDFTQKTAEAIGKLNANDISRVAKKFIRVDGLVKITAIDVKKATAPAATPDKPADKTK